MRSGWNCQTHLIVLCERKREHTPKHREQKNNRGVVPVKSQYKKIQVNRTDTFHIF
jgi:hypothetical protein